MGSKLTTEIFIERATCVHNGKYDYSESTYIRRHTDIDIICPIHGKFTQVAHYHLLGYGCKQCGIEQNRQARMKSTQQYIIDARKVHDNRYDYSKVEYDGIYSLINIECPVHGMFIQRAHDHLNGCGCPSCTKSGYKSNQKGYLYIQIVNEDVYKLGITNNPSSRIEQINSKSEFNHQYYKIFSSDDGKIISLLEREILKEIPHGVISKDQMKDGYTETFSSEYIDKVLEIILSNNITEEVL